MFEPLPKRRRCRAILPVTRSKCGCGNARDPNLVTARDLFPRPEPGTIGAPTRPVRLVDDVVGDVEPHDACGDGEGDRAVDPAA